MRDIYLVTDEDVLNGRNLYDIVENALKGGVSMVQLREKRSSTRDYIEHAKKLIQILKPYGVPLIINDRVDVALASGADGVHIGQSDMDYLMARKLMGQNKIIGLSVESKEQVFEAEAFDVDYIAASPVFSTTTKENTITEWGVEGLKWIRANSRHKLVAIGGINGENIDKVVEAGADTLAVVSAIICADDVFRATKELVEVK